MMNFSQYSNPINVLQRAKEHVEVGQKQVALQLLYDTFTFINQRRVYPKDKEETMRLFHTWSQTHEDMMNLYMELCVDLRDSIMARDGIHAYRNIADKNPRSIESVITRLFDLADKRLAAALATSRASAALALDDLDEGLTPEAVMLATVSSEQERGRSESSNLVTAWLMFNWELLRNVLDLLKTSPGLETAYHATAFRAFAFCRAHERKNEFRKLSINLKLHFADLQRFSKEALLSDTLELHLATRFEQLKTATALRLWTEGFSTIGDIHKILDLMQKKPPAQLMATYYQKLTQLFIMSGNYLFHAYANKAYYELSKEKNRSLTKDQVRVMANQVVLSALSIPLPSLSPGASLSQMSLQKEKDRRLAQLVGFELNPDRASLLASLVASRVLDECSDKVLTLHEALESDEDFAPRQLVGKVAPILAWLKADAKLECYVKPLEELVVLRLIAQLSRAYSLIKLKDLLSLLQPLGLPALDVERMLVRAVRNRKLPGATDVRINHAEEHVLFVAQVMHDHKAKAVLTSLADKLLAVRPKPAAEPRPAPRLVEEHAVAQRRQTLAARRAEVDAVLTGLQREKADKEEEARRQRAEREAQREEQARAEQQRAEEERRRRAEDEIRQASRLAAIGISAATSAHMTLEEKERLVAATREKQEQAAQEAERKAVAKLKKLDVFIRASRDLERPLLVQRRLAQMEQSRKDFEAAQALLAQRAVEEHAAGLARKAQLAEVFRRQSEFEALVGPIWDANVARAKAVKLEARAARFQAEKYERARQSRDDALRARRLEEEASRRREMEEKRIQEAEAEIARNERAAAAAPPQPSQRFVQRDAGDGPPQRFVQRDAGDGPPQRFVQRDDGPERPTQARGGPPSIRNRLGASEPPQAQQPPPQQQQQSAPGAQQPWRPKHLRQAQQ